MSTPARTVHLEVPTLGLVLLHARAVLGTRVGLDVPAAADPPPASSAGLDPEALANWDELWVAALRFRVTGDSTRVPAWFSAEHRGLDRVEAARWTQERKARLVEDVLGEGELGRARADSARLAGFHRVVVLPLVGGYALCVDDATLAVSEVAYVDDAAWAQALAVR
jgi:hypothetical protein